jgi:hypothetical protein
MSIVLMLAGDTMKMRKRFIISLGVVVALVAVATPLLLRWRATSLRNACANQLRQIHAPMACCVPMVNGLAEGAALDPKEVVQYIKDGTIPRCPCGPEYEIVWKVGGPPPKCPYHGALIGKDAGHEH